MSKKLALIGLPNSGKSALFNALTGSRQKVANFPGITVEKKLGLIKSGQNDIEVLDLPGLYSLDARSEDERLTRDFILKKYDDIDLYVLVIDSTNLRKSFYLATQLKDLNVPFKLVLNMSDLSKKRGQELDLKLLKTELGVDKIYETVAVTNQGVKELRDDLVSDSIDKAVQVPDQFISQVKEIEYVKERIKTVESLYRRVVLKEITKDGLTERLDSVLLHPIWGVIALLAIFILTFQLLFAGADPFIGLIEQGFEWIASIFDGLLNDGYLKSLLIDGVIGGVGSFVVFLPHIIFLFILINLLEDFGYLGRVAFLLDYIMRKLGLPGKAVVPLLSSHACAIPGIMGARIIENKSQRLLTMMISPLMTCSARLPVYTLLIGAIFSKEITYMGLGARGLLMFALYFFAIFMGFLISFITKKATATQTVNTLMMELPPYRTPKLKNVLFSAWQKGVVFLKKAGTVIFVLSIIIWGLVTFPSAPEDADRPAINYSYAAMIGKTFEPVFKPIGFDWKITTSLIPSFAAREVLVSAMGTVMAVDEEDEDTLMTKLSTLMRNEYSIATLLSLLVWFVFSPQCIATFGVLRRETNGFRYPVIFGVYTLILAYIFSFIVFSIAS